MGRQSSAPPRAVLGHEGHPRSDAGGVRRQGLAIERDAPPFRTIEAKEDARKLAPPRAHEPEEAEDLAFADRERDVL